MDLTDEIDLTILDLFDFTAEHGVSPFETLRLLNDRIRDAYLLMTDLEDRMADIETPSTALH